MKFVCAGWELVRAASTWKLRFLPQLHERDQHEFSYILMYKLCMWSDNCGLEHELKTRFCFIFKAVLHYVGEVPHSSSGHSIQYTLM